MRIKKLNSNKMKLAFSSFFTIFVVLYFSGSALYVVTEFKLSVVLSILCSCLFFPRILKHLQNKISLCDTAYLFFIFLISLNTVLYFENLTFNLFLISIISIAYSISLKYSDSSLKKTIINVTLFLALSTIIGTFLLRNTTLLNNLPEGISGNGWTYKIGIIYNYLPVIENRVMGLFWEPGILASYLSVGLIVYITTLKDKIHGKNLLYIGLIIWSIILSTSSAGYILVVLSITLLSVRGLKNESGYRFLFRFLTLIILIIGLLSIEEIINFFGLTDNEYVKKLLFSNIENSSRFLAFDNNIKGWLMRPIFGYGLTDAQSAAIQFYDVSTTTYLMILFGIGGLVYTILFIYGILNKKMNSYMKLLIIAMLFIIINKEPHYYNLATWLILFVLLKNERRVVQFG